MSSSSLSSLVNNAHAAKHATSNSGPLSSFDKNAASLPFHCPEVLVLLRPDSAFVSSGISSRAPWPTIRGALELDLPKTRKIEGIEVELKSQYELRPPWGKVESGKLFSKKQILEISPSRIYTKGKWTFLWELAVDPNTAPIESCPFGKIRQKVVARAPGIGAFGSDATAQVTLAFIVIDAPPGELPPSLLWRHEAHSEDLGPYSLDLASDTLMISALVNLRFRLHDPPHSVVIHGITLNVEQKIEIQVANGAFKRAAQPLNMVVFAWDGGRTPGERTIDDISVGRQDPLQPFHPRQCHLCTLQPGQPKEFNDLAQLPDDQWLRASTIDGIKTPIRVSHTLQVHVYYQAPGNPKDMRQFTMSRPVTIAHCCTISPNLTLPGYGEEEVTLVTKPGVSRYRFDCACGMTLSSLVKQAQETGLHNFWERQHNPAEPPPPKLE